MQRSPKPKCYKCGTSKNLHVHARRTLKDGTVRAYLICNPCNNAYVGAMRKKHGSVSTRRANKKYYEANKDKFREWARLRREKRKTSR